MIQHTSYAPAPDPLDAAVIDEVRQLLAAELGDAAEQLSDAELRAYLVDLIAAADDGAPPTCIQALFERQVERAPQALALVAADGRLTYQELNVRANQVAAHLRHLGVSTGALVGICATRSLEMVIGILGILKAGGAYVPLDPAYPHERLAFIIKDTAIPVLLTQQRLRDALPAHAARVVCLDADWPLIAQRSQANPVAPDLAGHLAYVIYTSGSTSTPKGVLIGHAGLAHYAQAMREPLSISADDVYLHTASFAFSSSVRQLLVPLAHGAAVVIAAAEQIGDPLALFELVRRQGVTIMDMIPSYWRSCVYALRHQDAATRATLLGNRLRLICSASEPLLSDIPDAWSHEFMHRARLMNMFGQTETTGIVAVYPIPHRPAGRVKVVEIGRPIDRTQLYLLDANLQIVPPGIAGEVYIGGAGLALGYLNQPGLTAARFLPDAFSGLAGARLYQTGDLACYAADGTIEFLGRRDHQVKIRGVRIELGEVEGVLRQHPLVDDAVVVAREDVPGDKRLVAYIVPTTPHPPSSIVGELRSFMQAKLPAYMIPWAFVVLAALPRMPNGKLNRQALPPPDLTRPDLDRVYVAPRTPVEEALAQVWAEVLRIQQIGIYDHFFELGGDSILAMQVIVRANQAGLSLTPRQLFLHTSIAELARVVGSAPAVQADQGLVTGPVPLTPSQHWFFELNLSAPHHFNQAHLFEVHAPLTPAVVEQAVRHLLAHHDALRMRFVHEADGWRQFNQGVAEPAPFAWFDFSALPEPEQQAAIESAAMELQLSLDLLAGPLIRVALFELGAGRPCRLFIIIHHLVMDGVSRRIVLEDLYNACLRISEGQPVQLPPKTTAFKHWAERLSAYARTPKLDQELDYWLAKSRACVAPLPVDHTDGAYTLDSSDVVSMVVSIEETRALLQDVPRAYRTQINDLLLTAVLHTFSDWTATSTLLVDVVGHAREPIFDDVDLSRTVGWCSATFPVLLERATGNTAAQTLRAVSEQLRRIPGQGIGYGLLLSMRGDPALAAQLGAMPQPQVVFSYTASSIKPWPAHRCSRRRPS